MIITSLASLGEQIRERRLKLGLTQEELAERVGSTRQLSLSDFGEILRYRWRKLLRVE